MSGKFFKIENIYIPVQFNNQGADIFIYVQKRKSNSAEAGQPAKPHPYSTEPTFNGFWHHPNTQLNKQKYTLI
ncbi:MAG: hypothetical protein IKR94_09050 [Bacteroidales bacterium]|nr:hypothetical protein [Bacteroidales bacterium]